MSWTNVLFALAIALIYVPMVFLGANAFFPDESAYSDCYERYPYPQTIDGGDVKQTERMACERSFEESRKETQANRFVFISVITLVVLLVAAFVSSLPFAIGLGLFLGGVVASFASSIAYFDANSRLGFVILLILFVVVLFAVYRWVVGSVKRKR